MVDTDQQRLAQKIDEALHESGLTPADAARLCDVTPQAVNGWLRTGRIRKSLLAIIARATNRPIEWFFESAMHQPRAEYSLPARAITVNIHEIPVVGTAQLGDNGFWAPLEYPAGHGDGYINYPTRDAQAYAIRVKGDSMRPRIKPGEYVIIEPEAPVEPGHEVLVKTRDGRVMVKVLNFRRNGIIELSSINEDHRPITLEENEIEIIHSVAGIAKSSLYKQSRS